MPSCCVQITWGKFSLLLLVALLCLLLSEMTAITAHFPQGVDFSVRNAVYESLVACDWPLYTKDGSFFVYYLGYWLFPAALSKFFPSNYMWWILEGWFFVGVFLMSVLLILKRGGRALFFLVILLSLADIVVTYHFFYHYLHKILGYVQAVYNLNIDCVHELSFYILKRLSFLYFYPAPFANYINSYHLVLPSWCILALLLTDSIDKKAYLLVASFLLICSPLSGVALCVFLFCYWIKEKNRWSMVFNVYTLAACFFLIPLALFYCLNESGFVAFTFNHREWLHARPTIYCNVFFILAPAFLILKEKRKSVLFCSFVLLFLVLPLVWVGASHANEFLYKGSCVMWFLLAWLYSEKVNSILCSRMKWAFLLILFIPLIFSIFVKLGRFSMDDEKIAANIQNRLNGHFNHEDGAPYCFQFKGKQPSALFYQTPGESANGVLKPFSTGMRPDCFRGMNLP